MGDQVSQSNQTGLAIHGDLDFDLGINDGDGLRDERRIIRIVLNQKNTIFHGGTQLYRSFHR